MNLKITYNWLLEYLETDADPYEIQKYLSLCGPSVERVEKIGDDFTLDIEVTSNRVDAASVFGIAQECQAILPRFGKKAILKQNPLEDLKFENLDANGNKHIDIEIKNPKLASRIATIVLSDLELSESNQIIKTRLEMCDQRSINNIVDVSNYIRLSLGQPCHIFDYDLIKDQKMIIEESKLGENVETLDGKKIKLPGGDIIIRDGSGKIIDLAAIMGAMSSSVNDKTKNILLFVPVFDSQKVRRTSMTTGQRSDSVTYFEKGLDETRVEPALVYAIELLQKYAKAKIGSKVYDIYPKPVEEKIVNVKTADIDRLIGVEIPQSEIVTILSNLGFEIYEVRDSLTVKIPSYRTKDVDNRDDIVEEVARIYGYHNIPSILQPINKYLKQPEEFEKLFIIQDRIKKFLKHIGLHENMNYSMISEAQIKNLDLDTKNHLALKNTISEDIKYLRRTLLPSLIKNIKDNIGKKSELKFFEIAKIYLPKNGELPQETYELGVATNNDFFDLKGIIESLFSELNLSNYEMRLGKNKFFADNSQLEIFLNAKKIGSFGELKGEYQLKFGLKNSIYLAEIDLQALIENFKFVPTYKPISRFAVIKLDSTMKGHNFSEIRKVFETSPLLLSLSYKTAFKNNITVSVEFSSSEKNITEKEAQAELSRILKKLT